MFRSALIFLLFLCVLVRAQAATGPDPGAVFDELAARLGAAPALVRSFTDNTQAWYARWYVLEHARKTIDVTYYIVENDVFGRSFLGLLLKKAREGVRVRLMLDARGTKALSRRMFGQDLLHALAALPNVEVKVYNPIYKALLALPEDLRSCVASNHDKLVIVDGTRVLTGGRNISRNYFADRADHPAAYRDTDILIEGGDVPAQATTAFEEEFNKDINHPVTPDAVTPRAAPRLDLDLARSAMQQHLLGLPPVDASSLPSGADLAEIQGELAAYPRLTAYAGFEPWRGERAYPVLLLDKHSLREQSRNDITANLQRLTDAAQEEVLIQNPYVVLTRSARDCLKRASARGVKILINTNSPESSDSLLTQAMFVREWKDLLRDIPTLRIFALRGENKLHAKVFVVDRKVTVVGTYNMDPLSESVNGEEVAAVKSPPFAQQSYLRIMQDVEGSIEYRIRVEPDGSVAEVSGPSSHVSSAALSWIQRLGCLAFLRPVI